MVAPLVDAPTTGSHHGGCCGVCTWPQAAKGVQHDARQKCVSSSRVLARPTWGAQGAPLESETASSARARARERERDRERETERQRDRETERESERETELE